VGAGGESLHYLPTVQMLVNLFPGLIMWKKTRDYSLLVKSDEVVSSEEVLEG
jgi:hypothetical protein